MIRYTIATTKNELEQILVLQQRNLPSNISEEEKQQQGFVTVEHNFDLLKRMNDVCPHIIAKEKGLVIGYALCMHPTFGDEIEVLLPMFRHIEMAIASTSTSLNKELTNFMVMGQVCVDKEYRGQGVFRALYSKMKEELIPAYSAIITEVDTSNTRSLNAHSSIGFQKLSAYKSDGHDWELIYLK